MTYEEARKEGEERTVELETEILVRTELIQEQQELVEELKKTLALHKHSEAVRECKARSTMVGS